jgi:hypothetical protein
MKREWTVAPASVIVLAPGRRLERLFADAYLLFAFARREHFWL